MLKKLITIAAIAVPAVFIAPVVPTHRPACGHTVARCYVKQIHHGAQTR